MDKLQKLHTLHNLSQLLKGGPQQLPGVPHTLRDSQLESEAQSLRDGYLAESIAKLAAADKEYQDALAAMSAAAESQPAGIVYMRVFSYNNLQYNHAKHFLVPKHEIVPKGEEESVLKHFNLNCHSRQHHAHTRSNSCHLTAWCTMMDAHSRKPTQMSMHNAHVCSCSVIT